MKKNLALLGLIALILFSACQKQNDIQSNFKQNIEEDESATSSRGGGHHNDDVVFYLLGEGNMLDQYSTDGYERKGSATITGLSAGVKIMAIDFRPATGQLYGVGNDSRIYVINPKTGAARAIGAGPFTPAIAGTPGML